MFVWDAKEKRWQPLQSIQPYKKDFNSTRGFIMRFEFFRYLTYEVHEPEATNITMVLFIKSFYIILWFLTSKEMKPIFMIKKFKTIYSLLDIISP